MRYSIICAIFVFSVMAQPGSFSYYNCFQDDPGLSGAYVDGTVFSGPFRANGPVRITSESSGRDNDPYFYIFTLSSDYYIYGWGTVQSAVPHVDDLWIEPYELMELGPPWFNLGVDPLPFGPDHVDWQTVRTTAVNSGLYLTAAEVADGSRILIEDGLLHILQTEYGAEEIYDLTTLQEPVVWIENDAGDRIFVKSSPGSGGFSEELTLGALGSIYLAGPLEYHETSPGMLGLISVYGDCLIADDPLTSDWPSPFDIVTDQDFTVSASILLLDGDIFSENFIHPTPVANLTLFGGIQMLKQGWTSTGSSGFNLQFSYDDRLLTESPPWYPQYQSESVEEESGSADEPFIEVLENPFSGSLIVQILEETVFQVYDQSGRIVQQDLSSSPPGVYLVRAVTPEGCTETVRVVKIQ